MRVELAFCGIVDHTVDETINRVALVIDGLVVQGGFV